MAVPVYGTQFAATGASAANVVLTKPASTANGDGLVAFIILDYNADPVPGLSAPAGWSLVLDDFSALVPGLEGHILCYMKLAESEPADWTWSWTGTPWREAVVLRFTGVNTANGNAGIADVVSRTTPAETDTNINWSNTTTVDETLLVLCARQTVGAAGYTGPGTERYDTDETGVFTVAGPAVAGATGTLTVTSGASGQLQVVGAAMRPPAAAGGGQPPRAMNSYRRRRAA